MLGGEATQSKIPGAATVGFIPLENGQTRVNYGLSRSFADLKSLLVLAVRAAFRKHEGDSVFFHSKTQVQPQLHQLNVLFSTSSARITPSSLSLCPLKNRATVQRPRTCTDPESSDTVIKMRRGGSSSELRL